MEDIRRTGRAAEAAKGLLLRGQTCAIQGTDKNLTYFCVASLAQLLVDPYYRTLDGFCVLINKDWVNFNFPFEAGIGLGLKPSERIAPVFELFINCVWVLTLHYPNAFAFNEACLQWSLWIFFF